MIEFNNAEINGCHIGLQNEWSNALHNIMYGNIVLGEEII
jgi:hypothetical protein